MAAIWSYRNFSLVFNVHTSTEYYEISKEKKTGEVWKRLEMKEDMAPSLSQEFRSLSCKLFLDIKQYLNLVRKKNILGF
jgi:hypothetical protein